MKTKPKNQSRTQREFEKTRKHTARRVSAQIAAREAGTQLTVDLTGARSQRARINRYMRAFGWNERF